MSYHSFSLVRAAKTVVTPAVTHSFCCVGLATAASTFLNEDCYSRTWQNLVHQLLKFLMHDGEIYVGLGWCLTGIEGVVGISRIGCVNIYFSGSKSSL